MRVPVISYLYEIVVTKNNNELFRDEIDVLNHSDVGILLEHLKDCFKELQFDFEFIFLEESTILINEEHIQSKKKIECLSIYYESKVKYQYNRNYILENMRLSKIIDKFGSKEKLYDYLNVLYEGKIDLIEENDIIYEEVECTEEFIFDYLDYKKYHISNIFNENLGDNFSIIYNYDPLRVEITFYELLKSIFNENNLEINYDKYDILKMFIDKVLNEYRDNPQYKFIKANSLNLKEVLEIINKNPSGIIFKQKEAFTIRKNDLLILEKV